MIWKILENQNWSKKLKYRVLIAGQEGMVGNSIYKFLKKKKI